jgi:cysteine desulfurase family protein (TIGR01976 family)
MFGMEIIILLIYKTCNMNANFRANFPVLSRQENEQPLIFLDGPAGTQVPQQVIDAISQYYTQSNANTHGTFLTSMETDEIMESTRGHVATFLGAEGPDTISFGQNMTTLNFSLSRAIGKHLQPGDEILITQLDHESNRGPWLALREKGIIVREVKIRMDAVIDYEDLASKINEKTKLVAMGAAANLTGTINDIALVRRLTHQVGAWLLIDAVHFAPHFPIDVISWGCDFLLCSAYKFYGPHVGILYSRPGLLDQLPTYRLRTAGQQAPESIETGTLNHAAIAGVRAAIKFIAEIGAGNNLRQKLFNALADIHQHEINLAKKLYYGLSDFKEIELIGPSIDQPMRAPTIALAVEGMRPEHFCKKLAQHNIFGWDGHFYALRGIEVLGLLEDGGVTRLGISAYTVEEEIDKTLAIIKEEILIK